MKRFIRSCTAFISLMAAALICTSCIYDRPAGDNFYRTLWTASESPFEGLTIEFLCGGAISAQADNAAGSFGTYSPDGSTAYFTGLHLILDQGTVLIEEAHRTDDDQMLLSWHFEGSSDSSETEMHRLSNYPE